MTCACCIWYVGGALRAAGAWRGAACHGSWPARAWPHGGCVHAQLSGHTFPITAVRWRADGDYLVVQCADRSVYVWQLCNGHLDRHAVGEVADDIMSSCDTAATAAEERIGWASVCHAGLAVAPAMQHSILELHALRLDGVSDRVHVISVNVRRLIRGLYALHRGGNGSGGGSSAASLATPSDGADGTPRQQAFGGRGGEGGGTGGTAAGPDATPKRFARAAAELLLSHLLSWDASTEERHRRVAIELDLHRPVRDVCFGLHGAGRCLSLQVPGNASHRRWYVSPYMSAMQTLPIVALSKVMIAVDTEARRNGWSMMVAIYSVMLDDAFPRMVRPSVVELIPHWQDPLSDLRQAARTILLSSLNARRGEWTKRFLSHWAKYLARPPESHAASSPSGRSHPGSPMSAVREGTDSLALSPVRMPSVVAAPASPVARGTGVAPDPATYALAVQLIGILSTETKAPLDDRTTRLLALALMSFLSRGVRGGTMPAIRTDSVARDSAHDGGGGGSGGGSGVNSDVAGSQGGDPAGSVDANTGGSYEQTGGGWAGEAYESGLSERVSGIVMQITAAELLGKGYSIFGGYIMLKSLLMRLIELTVMPPTTDPSSSQAIFQLRSVCENALMQIASADLAGFVRAIESDAALATSIDMRLHVLRIIRSLLRNRLPSQFTECVPVLAELLVHAGDPSVPGLRQASKQEVQQMLLELMQRFGNVSFHQPTQRIAAGSSNGARARCRSRAAPTLRPQR